MSNILVLTSQYTGTAGANGICTRNIVEEMKKKGHNISVICFNSGISEENVYTIPAKETRKKRNPVDRVVKFLRSFFFAVLDRETEQNFKKLTLSLCEKLKIDTVICVFFPLETASVVCDVKMQFPHIKTIIYELDSIGDGIFSSSKLRYFAKLAYEHWGDNNYNYCDKVVIMKSHESYWKKVWGKRFAEKLLIADIPVLAESTIPFTENRANTSISFLYGGILDRKYRSPEYLLSVFNAYTKNKNAVLDFYSKGDCEELIASFGEKNANIRRKGYVPAAVLKEAIARTDVLVSIGNKVSRSVPSKLITYLSYGKLVVHFSSQRNDVCIEYLEKYPLGLTLHECDPLEENVSKLHAFIEKNRGKTIEFSEVAKILKMNTPKYSADLIEDNNSPL